MFGIKTRKIHHRIDKLWSVFSARVRKTEARVDLLERATVTIESRIRALEEATKPKSRKVKSDG